MDRRRQDAGRHAQNSPRPDRQRLHSSPVAGVSLVHHVGRIGQVRVVHSPMYVHRAVACRNQCSGAFVTVSMATPRRARRTDNNGRKQSYRNHVPEPARRPLTGATLTMEPECGKGHDRARASGVLGHLRAIDSHDPGLGRGAWPDQTAGRSWSWGGCAVVVLLVDHHTPGEAPVLAWPPGGGSRGSANERGRECPRPTRSRNRARHP